MYLFFVYKFVKLMTFTERRKTFTADWKIQFLSSVSMGCELGLGIRVDLVKLV